MKRAISVARKLLDALSITMAVFAGLGVILTLIIICLDVFLRMRGGQFEGTTILVTNYLMVMVAYLPLAQIERTDKMITVDVVSHVLSERSQRVVEFVAAGISLAIYLSLAHATWNQALTKQSFGAYRSLSITSTLMIWPAYWILPISFVLAATVILMRLIEATLGRPIFPQGLLVPDRNRRPPSHLR
jgi:TRAP-type C4-dicarboxylate transport system permease small subunit